MSGGGRERSNEGAAWRPAALPSQWRTLPRRATLLTIACAAALAALTVAGGTQAGWSRSETAFLVRAGGSWELQPAPAGGGAGAGGGAARVTYTFERWPRGVLIAREHVMHTLEIEGAATDGPTESEVRRLAATYFGDADRPGNEFFDDFLRRFNRIDIGAAILAGDVDEVRLDGPRTAINLAAIGALAACVASWVWMFVMFRPRWARWKALRSLREGRCCSCGYSLEGLTGMVCPECGTDLAAARAEAESVLARW